MDTPLRLSIVAGEVIAAGLSLTVISPQAIDRQSAQAALRIRPVRGPLLRSDLRIGDGGRRAEISTAGLPPGAYELVIGALYGEDGSQLVEPHTVPFAIGALTGAIPDDHRVEHAVHLAVGELGVTRLSPGARPADGGVYLELVKAVHRETGEPAELAFDSAGRRVEAGEMLAAVDKRRLDRFGTVHETLWRHLRTIDGDTSVDVVVWPRWEAVVDFDKPADRRSVEPHPAELESAAAARRATESLMDVLKELGVKAAHDSADGPPLRVTLSAAKIRELAGSDAVGAIFVDDRDGINDLADSIAVARSDRAQNQGFTGRGVRVAVFENGPKTTTNLDLAGRFTTSPTSSTNEDKHARLTHAIVKNTEKDKPHGHAPGCRLYSADSTDNDALRWAIRQGCTVISQSFHRGSEPEEAVLQADDLLKDYLALRWPYPTIVQAAGNFWADDPDDIDPPSDEYVNHKGFNTLSVGNHDDTASAMSGDSVFRNPTSPRGDRELPELAANGTGVKANGQAMSGTSFAAPAAAGVAALLQDVDPVLSSWPEGCRAILLASAGRNVSGSTWWNDVSTRTDASDGAGAVDAESGVLIALQRRFRNAPATARGWDVGTLTSADFGPDRLATFRYRVTVPALLWAPRVKVALAWNSRVLSLFGAPLTSTLTVDYDLVVRNSQGQQVAVSASWDNSYEIAEFSATRGATYEIVIRRWSGSDSGWFGIAWAATGIRLFAHRPVLH